MKFFSDIKGNILEGVEDKILRYIWRRFVYQALLHWHTSLMGLIPLFYSLGDLVKYLADAQPDSIHAHDLKTAWVPVLTAVLGMLANDPWRKNLDKEGIPRAEVVQ